MSTTCDCDNLQRYCGYEREPKPGGQSRGSCSRTQDSSRARSLHRLCTTLGLHKHRILAPVCLSIQSHRHSSRDFLSRARWPAMIHMSTQTPRVNTTVITTCPSSRCEHYLTHSQGDSCHHAQHHWSTHFSNIICNHWTLQRCFA